MPRPAIDTAGGIISPGKCSLGAIACSYGYCHMNDGTPRYSMICLLNTIASMTDEEEAEANIVRSVDEGLTSRRGASIPGGAAGG